MCGVAAFGHGEHETSVQSIPEHLIEDGHIVALGVELEQLVYREGRKDYSICSGHNVDWFGFQAPSRQEDEHLSLGHLPAPSFMGSEENSLES
jgi:hypothetical protein